MANSSGVRLKPLTLKLYPAVSANWARGMQAATAFVGLLLRTVALDNQHLNDFLARSHAGVS